jgi:hypothetical protein
MWNDFTKTQRFELHPEMHEFVVRPSAPGEFEFFDEKTHHYINLPAEDIVCKIGNILILSRQVFLSNFGVTTCS